MAYKCPRCNADVQRAPNRMGAMFGLVGALVMMAFSSFECLKCGPIPRSEFPSEVRTQMLLGSVGLIVGAIAVIIALVAFIAWVNTW